MERSASETVSYGDFTHAVREMAQLDDTVCRIFNLAIPNRPRPGDLRSSIKGDLLESYLRLRDTFSVDEFVVRSRNELRDHILDEVAVSAEIEPGFDWEDFASLVDAVIDMVWEQVQATSSEPRYLEAI